MHSQQAAARSASRGAADERGITLQTLIVTAVLVLMAVAAGVVIVAITTSSSDDLEESGTDVQARCNEVEIYDPLVASRNEIGVNLGHSYPFNPNDAVSLEVFAFQGSGIGCVPVCVWLDRRPNAAAAGDKIKPNGELEPGEVVFVRDLLAADLQIRRGRTLNIHLDNTDQRTNYVLSSGSSRDDIRFFARAGNGTETKYAVLDGVDSDDTNGKIAGPIDRIAVAPNQNECHTYGVGGNVLL